jgi:heme-degrading monooxygenase HmoA
MLRPELESVDGFVDNIRYKSLTRDGWILSLSGWRDEKSVVRWRIAMRHHMVQEKGRSEILLDYHLRVGQVTQAHYYFRLKVTPAFRMDKSSKSSVSMKPKSARSCSRGWRGRCG